MISRFKNKDESGCNCKGTIKPQLVAVAGCSDDLAAVSALPEEWVPRQCGTTLTNYLKERKIKHQRVLEDMLQETKLVNNNIGLEIRRISEILLSNIQQNKNEIDCIIKKSIPKEGVLSLEGRNEALKEITKFFTQRIQDLTKFKQEAQGLERRRAEGIKTVLRSQFQRLISVGYKTPKDLLHEFDERIYEINQQLLSNSRAFLELEGKLRIQLDEGTLRARSALNQFCIKQSTKVVRGQSALPWVQKNQLHKRSESADNRKRNESSDSACDLILDIEEFKEYVSQLVEAYRRAILKIFTGFSGQLEDLHKNIGFKSLEHNRSQTTSIVVHELDHMIERALYRISNNSLQDKSSVYKDLGDMARRDVLNMQKSLSTLGKCLHETYIILHEASHLWDEHILRSALVQKLTTAGIEDMQTTHDAIELANEINFNITLEQLRCAPDIDKLHQNFDITKNLLDRIAEIYLQHSEAEIAKLEGYMNLPAVMSNVLLSECQYFLENHPKSTQEPSGSITSSALSPKTESVYSLRTPLPRATLQTQLQEVALNNWKNGFLETFHQNLPVVSEELNHQARKWVDEKSLQLNMRYSLKAMSHSIRTERIQAAREARRSELRFHELRLNSHLEAISKLTNILPQEASLFLAIDAPTLYPFCKWVSDMQTNIDSLLTCDQLDPEVKRLKMSSYAKRLIKHRQHFEASLDAAVEQYKKNIEFQIQTARIANLKFMSQLKLFMEGGKYSPVEATKACAALVKAADTLEVCSQRTMDALNHRRSQLLALADQQMLPVQRIVEETYKVKGEVDKKKASKKK